MKITHNSDRRACQPDIDNRLAVTIYHAKLICTDT